MWFMLINPQVSVSVTQPQTKYSSPRGPIGSFAPGPIAVVLNALAVIKSGTWCTHLHLEIS